MGLILNTPLTVLRAGAHAWYLLQSFTGMPTQGRCLILMYHDIGDGVMADLFGRQMEYLSTVATVVSLETLLQIARRGAAQGISCAITFDDGYEGVYSNAFPRLLKHGFESIVYLSTGFMRESFNAADCTGHSGLIEGRRLLSWRQVHEMALHGVRFGSHMSEHGDLSVLGRREAMEQLRGSRDEISSHLGKPCEDFAYPFGRFTL
jgi:peptidoglycan/xylan/chitin deacetylase (PgdA/CDA1 family)